MTKCSTEMRPPNSKPEEASERGRLRKPDWLKVRVGGGRSFAGVKRLLDSGGLHTVCQEALCPNQGDCWGKGRATIMILGERCTRNCAFCNVGTDSAPPCDEHEPERVAEAVEAMGLREVVITSVTRDDLADGGADIWVKTIEAIRRTTPQILLEVLTPDYGGNVESIRRVVDARPDIFGHNLETVPSLYPRVRPQADYARSLELLATAAGSGLLTKTSLMLGLGESREEVLGVMRDARRAGCELLALGQYLQPSREHLPVAEYVTPEAFEQYRQDGLAMGFGEVVSGPLVRSSYHSEAQTAYVLNRLGRESSA